MGEILKKCEETTDYRPQPMRDYTKIKAWEPVGSMQLAV